MQRLPWAYAALGFAMGTAVSTLLWWWTSDEASAPPAASVSTDDEPQPTTTPRDKPARTVSDHPNVLILMWDTVRADRLSLLGHDRETTPWLDDFAQEALVFEHAISPSFWTVPSHASLFTGLPTAAHHTTTLRTWLQNEWVTLPEHFRDQGYETWLFSANPNLTDRTNLNQGFEVAWLSSDEPWKARSTAWHATKAIPRDRSTDRSLGFPKKVPKRYTEVHKDAGPIAAEALLAWLDERAEPDRPFFAFVNYMEAHFPRLPSLESREAILDEETLEAGLHLVAGMKRLSDATRGLFYLSPGQQEAMRGVYDASIRDLDRASGALVTELDRRGVLDDTIVVVVSDHGEAIGEHGIYGHNFSLYDELIHVPLVIRYPEKVPAARVTHPVSTADLYLTLTHLAGLPAASSPFPLRALSEVDPGEPIFSELRAYHGWNPDVPLKKPNGEWYPLRRRYRVTVRDQYKVIAASDQSIALFDRLQDPGETTDLTAARTALAEELAAAHEHWLEAFPAGPSDLSTLENEQRQSAQEDDLAEQLRALGYVQ